MDQKNKLLESLLRDHRLKAWVDEGDFENYWLDWIENHPGDLDILEDAKAIVRGLPVQITTVDLPEIENSFKELQSLVKPRKIPAREGKSVFSMTFLKYAAALVLLILGLYMWGPFDSPQPPIVTISEQTLPGVLENIDLPDSTHIVLNGNSKLEYHSDANERRVKLEGEAHFKVQKLKENSELKRFVVETPDLDVEVLGTTFSVSMDSIWTTIVLEEGTVCLKNAHTKDNSGSSYIMKPGEKVIYNSVDGTFSKKLVDAVGYNSWTSNKLSLMNRSVDELVRWFSNNHSITINISEDFADRELTGSVDLENKETAVRMIAIALGLKPVEVKENIWDFK